MKGAQNSFWVVAVHINWPKKFLFSQVLFLTGQNIDKKYHVSNYK